jgi:cytoskeletal protein RodZ
VGKRRRVALMVAVFLGLALIAAGGAAAAVDFGAEEPTESTSSTETTSPTSSPESTESTLLPDLDTTPSTEAESFGQIISALRHAGDHTPAAVLKGKKVPGWNPDKHATATTTTTAITTPGSETADAPGDDEEEGEEEELGPNGSSGNSGDKDHVPTAVLKGKTVPGWSK